MSSSAHIQFAGEDASSIPVIVVREADLEDWISRQHDRDANWIRSQNFKGQLGKFVAIPDSEGRISKIVAGYGSDDERHRTRFGLATVAAALPEGTYHLDGPDDPDELQEAALGWLLSGYSFSRYTGKPKPEVLLKCPPGLDAQRLRAIAEGEVLTRDLINTPAEDMGPAEIAGAAEHLADKFGAKVTVITGDDLLDQGFPLIHTVGRAADRAPRLVDISWGDSGQTITLVGKGVSFDTGGLNLKPGSSMALMKKDMGGAATVLGLAHMIMATGLNLRLRVLIPTVENAVSGNAFRPGDIFKSRKGLTVEINNTDAEGRLILADALAYADEDKPDLIVSMATLTGAARVAVGPDLAPFYTNHIQAAEALRRAAATVRDPVWEMPFHAPYEQMIEPGIADLDNAPSGGFAGSITAALFLKRFVTDAPYLHFDIYGWQPSPAPARPKGGVGQGARAVFAALPDIFEL